MPTPLREVIKNLLHAKTEIEYYEGLKVKDNMQRALADIDTAIDILIGLERVDENE